MDRILLILSNQTRAVDALEKVTRSLGSTVESIAWQLPLLVGARSILATNQYELTPIRSANSSFVLICVIRGPPSSLACELLTTANRVGCVSARISQCCDERRETRVLVARFLPACPLGMMGDS